MDIITSYKLNPEGAKQVGTSPRIMTKGAFTGTFTRAEAFMADSGAQGIEFSFKGPQGNADYLSIYTTNSDGEAIYGRKVLDAIMTVLRVRQITAQRGKVTKYDAKQGKEASVDATLFPELMGKSIGLLLVMEEYAKGSGERNWKPVIVGVFDPQTQQLPREVLDNQQSDPEAFDKLVESLKDRPLKTQDKKPAPRPAKASAGGFDDMDDDIPF